MTTKKTGSKGMAAAEAEIERLQKRATPPSRLTGLQQLVRKEWLIFLGAFVFAMIIGAALADLAR